MASNASVSPVDAGRPLRVLLVEDSRADARTFEIVLGRASPGGFDVTVVVDLAGAVAELTALDFDVVVLDLGLPDSDGPRSYASVRAAAGPVPIVVLTGMADDELAERLVDDGAQDFLVKGDYSGGSLARALRYAVQRQHAEAELEEAHRVAVEASRAKSEFVAGVSHEIRTPLNAILGMTEVLQGTELSPDQEEYVAIAHRAGQSLLDLINAVLDFSQIEAGRLQLSDRPFELTSLVESTCEFLAFQAHEKGIAFACRIAPELPREVVGDSARLRQILVNLIGNAIKFTSQGHVRVDVEPGPTGGASVRFVVRDTGIGIADDKLEAIFESFTQADGSVTRRFGGTGLGLTISSRLVDAMSGRIEVSSTLGSGSQFSVDLVLPATAATSDARRLDPGVRALVVDDDPMERALLAEQLESLGCIADVASGGAEAIRRLRDCSWRQERFDLVFVDCRMPDMNGFEVVDRLAQIPDFEGRIVMLLTTDHRRGDIERCAESGLAGYLLKPIKGSALRELVLATMDAREPALPEASEELAPPDAARRILLAEDSSDNQMLIRAFLKETPHELVVVENGLEAREAFVHEHFDLVLMDVQMPILDGISATREIRAFERKSRRRPTPIIALTAHAFEGEARKSLDAGCDEHVTKPIGKPRLLHLIESAPIGARGATAPAPAAGFTIRVDPEIADLVPTYLENRRSDIGAIHQAIEATDFEAVRVLGHNMKGTGRGYGCPPVSEVGARLEGAAKIGDVSAIDEAVGDLVAFLEQAEIAGSGAIDISEEGK